MENDLLKVRPFSIQHDRVCEPLLQALEQGLGRRERRVPPCLADLARDITARNSTVTR